MVRIPRSCEPCGRYARLRKFHLNGFCVRGGEWVEIFEGIHHETELDFFGLRWTVGPADIWGLDCKIEQGVVGGEGENPLRNLSCEGFDGSWE